MIRLTVAALLLASSASAQGILECADRAALIAELTNKFGETQRSAGLDGSGSVFELYASEDSGTWTALVSNPDGSACLIALGTHWTATKLGEPM